MIKKTLAALPKPCKMLVSVVQRYKKGQIKLKEQINLPASTLSNKRFPTGFPNIRKPRVQTPPKIRQEEMVLEAARFTAVLLPVASASETTGRSIREIEPVKAFGKRTSGRAMPVKTPYTLKAVAVSYP